MSTRDDIIEKGAKMGITGEGDLDYDVETDLAKTEITVKGDGKLIIDHNKFMERFGADKYAAKEAGKKIRDKIRGR